ncbi:hypothetical protein [Azotobacter chroococcum]|uniref:Uncharacterized protein n=1 Tax=Azotobacter chroococcum NCIMB 8003 TaxID=1328314 RepID=A0A0C4WX59_9GAMM|nr:hypothetical protein [Azotobacter chroococcum]AJE23552.1 Hypothetical protein Achr_d160 [Azotobacter chroococcum NCIMB 8003]
MNTNKQAGRMILENLQLFNQAVVLFEQELEPEIRAKFSEAIQTWANEHGWSSWVDATADIDNYSVAPPRWAFKDESGNDDANPWFEMGVVENSTNYYLAELFGVGSTSVTLWFCVNEKGLGFEGKKAWKKALQAVAEKYVEHLKPFGIVYDESYFHLPLKLDPSKLADAWSDDSYDELFEPLGAALDALEKAVTIFDEMLTEMRTSQHLALNI